MLSRPYKKRSYTAMVRQVPKRPIDKSIKPVTATVISGNAVVITLITATYPCTITGLRWSLNAATSGGTGGRFNWAIILLKEGVTPPTDLGFTGNSLYDPEQNVIAWGSRHIDQANNDPNFEGSTKSMRKLMGGDTIVVVGAVANNNTSSVIFGGGIQFFCKT